MAKKIGIAGFILVVAVLAFIGTRPERFRVERSAQISAPADVVFAMINDFHQWGRWSPWEKVDPDMKRTFEGPSAGPGAVYAWAGNAEVGEGRMTILESEPGELVSIELEFFEPFAATNEARFELAASEAETRVSWSMEGRNGFVGKAISVFMDMDAMVGKQFERGLADLDSAAQAETQELRQAAQNAKAEAREGEATP